MSSSATAAGGRRPRCAFGSVLHDGHGSRGSARAAGHGPRPVRPVRRPQVRPNRVTAPCYRAHRLPRPTAEPALHLVRGCVPAHRREAAMLAIVPSATLLGAEGRPVSVEVHVANGLPAFSVVGLPDEACREARDRVRAALAVERAALADDPHHRQPRAVRRAQERGRARPRHRRRRAGRRGRGAGRRRARAGLPRRARARRLGAQGPGDRAARRRARRVHAGRAAGVRSRGGARGPAGGPVGPEPVRAGRGARPRRAVAASRAGAGRRGRSGAAGPGRRAGPGHRPASPSRPRPPVATTSSCSGRRARARRCWPSACPACSPPSAGTWRWRPP